MHPQSLLKPGHRYVILALFNTCTLWRLGSFIVHCSISLLPRTPWGREMNSFVIFLVITEVGGMKTCNPKGSAVQQNFLPSWECSTFVLLGTVKHVMYGWGDQGTEVYFILINLNSNLNSHMLLVVAVLGSIWKIWLHKWYLWVIAT